MKALLILGGLRIGDCWHCVPIINKLRNDGATEITWVTGTYEKEVAEFLAIVFNINLIVREDGLPQDIFSRKIFLAKYKPEFNESEYDLTFYDYEGTFEFQPKWTITPDQMVIPSYFKHEKDNIVSVQPDSTSAIKRIDALFSVKYPYPVVSIGGNGERAIVGSTKCQGKPWKEVYSTIKRSRIYVGIHSAVTCLAFYLDIPMVVCDYGKNFNFAKYGRPDVIHLYDRPTTTQIEKAMDELLDKGIHS
jgi:ADP-heptose:LPS heptosyltransferase